MVRFSLALFLALALAGGALAEPRIQASARRAAFLPVQGLLMSGESLGGVRLGSTPAQVEATWGTSYTVCDFCRSPTWFYLVPGRADGGAVIFERSRAVAVFTLGTPFGWHTEKGLLLGDDVHSMTALYNMRIWTHCIGYNAASTRTGNTVTSIYTQGEVVYGFALTLASSPVCI